MNETGIYEVELAVCWPDGTYTAESLLVDWNETEEPTHRTILAAAEDLIDENQAYPGHVAIGLLRYGEHEHEAECCECGELHCCCICPTFSA